MVAVPQQVRSNPNATLSGGLTGVSLLAVNIADQFGVSLTSSQSVIVSGVIGYLGLWAGKAGAMVARRGIVGVGRMIWRGGG